MKKLDALVIGATGATGQEIVSQLLRDDSFNSVSIFVRKDPNITHSKLKTYIIDFSKIKSYKDLIKGDVLFSCLGTTLRVAGSKDKQYMVDYTYQYEFAKIASDNGVADYSLVSSIGANEKSLFFYPKIKGELEMAVKRFPFKAIQIFQPPTLIRQQELIRTGEKIGIKIFRWLNFFGILNLKSRYQSIFLQSLWLNKLKRNKRKKLQLLNP